VNQGSSRGAEIIDWSVSNLRYGRSILIDRAGNVLAGNQVTKDAIKRGAKIRTVTTDGEEVIAVQRTDVDLNGTDQEREKARGLALADNRASEVGYVADIEQLLEHQASGVDLTPLYRQDELDAMIASQTPPDVEFKEYTEDVENDVEFHECPECHHKWPK